MKRKFVKNVTWMILTIIRIVRFLPEIQHIMLSDKFKVFQSPRYN